MGEPVEYKVVTWLQPGDEFKLPSWNGRTEFFLRWGAKLPPLKPGGPNRRQLFVQGKSEPIIVNDTQQYRKVVHRGHVHGQWDKTSRGARCHAHRPSRAW